jgi:crotonobetainyl-CoA:carnitine CoA-transferase CaiB-like acyl-CoA transferase
VDSLPVDALPLSGLLVLDFSQFLAGPVAALRLADLGARVIKIERPKVGDSGRQLAFAGLEVDGDALSFHAMNRHKESFEADLKIPKDLARVRQLIEHADVIIQNFRPGVMERIGLDYETVRRINPRIVYASVTGYGSTGPWSGEPGQDLLAQARSGLPWLNGTRDDPPVPVGLAIADVLTANHLTTGVLACLTRRARTGLGGLVETSLLESMIDLQFEVVSAHLYDRSLIPRRGPVNSAHAYLGAPYGIYPTADGYLALAMNAIPRLGELIGLDQLSRYDDPSSWLTERDAIMPLLGSHLSQRTTQDWLDILQPEDIWCAPVLTLAELVQNDGFAAIDMTQRIQRDTSDGAVELEVTRIPIRIDGRPLRSAQGAPQLGADTDQIADEFFGSNDES